MLALTLTFLSVVCVFSQFADVLMPSYIKKALREKNQYKPMFREKKRTISNLTMKEVFDHIRGITRALNYNAKKNGFKVDYKFRVMDDLYP